MIRQLKFAAWQLVLRRFGLRLWCCSGESMTGQFAYEIQSVFTWQWAEFSRCLAKLWCPSSHSMYSTVVDTVIAVAERRSNLSVHDQPPICSSLLWGISGYPTCALIWTKTHASYCQLGQLGRHLAPDAENQLAFSAENRLALDASLLTSTTW